MKQYSKKLFSLIVLCSTATMLQADSGSGSNFNDVLPFIQWRSQGRDMARKLYGTTSYAVYQRDMDDNYGTFNATVQYDRTFRGDRLLCALFGDSLVNNTTTSTNNCSNNCSEDRTLLIQGLETDEGAPNTSRAATAWMAENFYLPRDFSSAITFSPRIQDVLLDLNLYVGLDRWVKGMYFRLYGPVVWNKASLRARENVTTPAADDGTDGEYEPGYFATTAVLPDDLFDNALSFFGGCTPTAIEGLTLQPLKFAKFSDCRNNNNNNNNNCSDECGSFSNHKTGFAELRGEFGWNYLQEKYRLMINIQAAAPTGTRPNAEYLFPAYIGNGKHWELGIGLGADWRMWSSEDGDKSFNFIFEADITHLFNSKQTMTFDLKNKAGVSLPNSRYMLAEMLAPTDTFPAAEQLVDGTFQFNGTYAPVANITTKEVKVSFGVQADLVAMFNYTCRGFSWDLGYNFWALSKSKFHGECDNSDNCVSSNSCPTLMPFVENTWALKGDASVYGFQPLAGTPPVATGNPTPLGATETETATIFKGNNGVSTVLADNPLTNPGVDNAEFASDAAGDLYEYNSANQIRTSVPPVFIAASDFDYDAARQKGLSNKVFTHFSYTWINRDRWIPYVGAGFSAEFGKTSCNDDECATTTTTTSNCGSGVSCALSKWAVEIKGGVSFH